MIYANDTIREMCREGWQCYGTQYAMRSTQCAECRAPATARMTNGSFTKDGSIKKKDLAGGRAAPPTLQVDRRQEVAPIKHQTVDKRPPKSRSKHDLQCLANI